MKHCVKSVVSRAAFLVAAWSLTAQAVDWDNAMLVGDLQRECPFFKPGEEMAFSIALKGAKGDIPPDTYFVDWERRGDDGITEKGRAPLPVHDPLVVRTSMDSPGFVCVEANVVTADGKRVPKNHRWEKRVFFMGGAAVSPDELKPGAEPADYEEFWRSVETDGSRAKFTASPRIGIGYASKRDQSRKWRFTGECSGEQRKPASASPDMV